MNIASDLPSPMATLATNAPSLVETGEAREAVADNESAETSPAKAPLRADEGKTVDLSV